MVYADSYAYMRIIMHEGMWRMDNSVRTSERSNLMLLFLFSFCSPFDAMIDLFFSFSGLMSKVNRGVARFLCGLLP